MLSLDAARTLANEYIMQVSDDVELYDDPILEGEFGWVFGYQSKRYIQTGHVLDALAGNAPLLVDRNKASLYVLGSAHPVEYYLNNYLEFGDPHKIGGSKVELVSRGVSVPTIDAIRCVRDRTNIGLDAAKRVVEECISGNRPSVDCGSTASAGQLIIELMKLGYVVKQLPE